MPYQETIEIEFKSEISEKSWQNWCKTVVAFSNTKGGKIVFGLNDDGSFHGIENSELDKKIRYIEQIIRNHVDPLPIYVISNYHVENNRTSFELIVSKRESVITWLLNGENPVMYVRREKMSVIATIEEMQEALLKMQSSDYDKTDIGIVSNIKHFNKLNEYYKRANDNLSLIDNDLISLNLTTPKSTLTITGLLFADNSNYRNANVVCNTWPETSKGSINVIDSKNFYGSVLEMFESMINYVKSVKYYSFGGVKQGIFFDDDGSFSLITLREAFINAFAHRDYKIVGSEIVVDCYPDRIEITSPGSMLQSSEVAKNIELEVAPSFRRNPNICRVFVKCKLMEEKGSGFAKIIDDYKSMSEVFKPTCSFNQKLFTVCLKNKKYNYGVSSLVDTPTTNPLNYLITKDMFKTRAQIFEEKPKMKLAEAIVKDNPYISYEQIQNLLEVSREGAKYYIRQLKDACLIRRIGNNISGYYEIVNDIDRPVEFLNLDSNVQSLVLTWCKNFFIPTKSFNDKHTSYSLKHILQDYDGTYLTNGQFKGAMILSDFKVKNIEDLNWIFNIAENSAALMLKLE